MNVRDETRHDIHKSAASEMRRVTIYIKAQRFYEYRDASHLWRSFSHNRTKINIQFLSEIAFQIYRLAMYMFIYNIFFYLWTKIRVLILSITRPNSSQGKELCFNSLLVSIIPWHISFGYTCIKLRFCEMGICCELTRKTFISVAIFDCSRVFCQPVPYRPIKSRKF